MKSFIISCMLLVPLLSLSQVTNKNISGQIKDIQNAPVAGALIQLKKVNDSTAVHKTISKENGKFVFGNLSNDSFVLIISSAGSKKYTSNHLAINEQRTTIVLPVIILIPAEETELKAVTVTARKPLLEQDIDKTIVNVEAMMSSATSNALEVLQKTPGIIVEANGDISLNGRQGVTVLIEGRPTYMSASDLAAYLRSIPGSTLDKIELMSNPPAKYDAEGNAVINIRLKRSRTQGYTGSASLSFAQGTYNSSYNAININYLDKKVNLFGNLSINADKNFDEDKYDRVFYDSNYIKTSSAQLHNYYTYKLYDLTARLGMDYSLSSKTIIGFITSMYGRNKTEQMDYNNSIVFYANNIPDSSGYGNTSGNSKWRQATANINLLHKFNTHGKELSADINYINYNNTGNRLLNNFIALDNAGADSNYIFQYYQPSDINIYTFKTDYSHPFNNKMVLSAGIKSSFVKNDNASDYTDIVENTHKPDQSKSNHFIYNEHINAIYINARKDWKRFGVQLGLRAENTNTKGHQLGNDIVPDSTNTNHYTGIFPSLFVSYKLDSAGRHNLSVNLSRRINRPNYQQLNPFLIFLDQYSYSTGNPYLGPSYHNYLELNYRYKQFIGISFQYNRNTQGFFNATQVMDNIFISRPENTQLRSMMAIMNNLNFPVAKWWKLNINIAGAHFLTKGSLYDQNLDQRIYAYRFGLLSQFTLAKNWNAEISGRYTSSTIQLQRIYAPRYYVDAGIQKKILKGKASIRLNASDIFYTLNQKEQITGLPFAASYHITTQDSRRISIAININFGKDSFKRKRSYNDNAADDEKGRVN